MKLSVFRPVFVWAMFSLFLIGCTKEDSVPLENAPDGMDDFGLSISGEIAVPTELQDNQGPHKHVFLTERSAGFTEGFESTTKGSYTGAEVQLSSSGSWFLSDALLGSLSNDRKFGTRSVRIRNTGYAIMNFNMDNGVELIRVRHAVYGGDGSSTWRLIVSYDNGGSWFFAGNTITTSSTALNTVTFTINDPQPARYGVYKTGGGGNRLNIDNVEVTTATSGGGGGSGPTRDSNLTFGNPSNAGTSATNYFLAKDDYTLSYNNDRGTANWVSWHLSSAWTGNTSRCNCFRQDTDLPGSFFRATTSDYTNSGFDRGHLCPSADRNGSSEDNANTYFMTNIAPQSPDNNQRSWATFENYLRSLTEQGFEVHLVSGVAGSGGTGRNGFASTIDGGNITVPDSFWKVALVLPNGSDDISRVNSGTRIIAINVPNDQNISTDWQQFLTSVDAIEALTGYDLFENIPDSVEAVVEAQVDSGASS
ncbi:DNA/RNA non-specific endonuclease [Maribacter sp. 2-571]|uniref:DNA/RNA non-specific endonuclease n=1 Tax=Maribacter sp. 2-571 TaxID=3417569 RepID=UPI003D335E74